MLQGPSVAILTEPPGEGYEVGRIAENAIGRLMRGERNNRSQRSRSDWTKVGGKHRNPNYLEFGDTTSQGRCITRR